MIVVHRLHTPGGRWSWMDGPPTKQAADDARNFGWTLEFAYPAAVVESMRDRMVDLERQRDELLSREWQAIKARRAAETRLRELLEERREA